jgi:hypothetical protein
MSENKGFFFAFTSACFAILCGKIFLSPQRIAKFSAKPAKKFLFSNTDSHKTILKILSILFIFPFLIFASFRVLSRAGKGFRTALKIINLHFLLPVGQFDTHFFQSCFVQRSGYL